MANGNNQVAEAGFAFGAIMAVFTIVMVLIVGTMIGCPHYTVYQQGMAGQAKLKEAESSRQIATLEAKAKHEAAKELAFAEVERAKGVAEANKIIGDSLKGKEEYLRYLWIHGVTEGRNNNDVIYVPTEASIPILESGRFAQRQWEAAHGHKAEVSDQSEMP